ncbi:hypothetical protein [Chryseobacterium sp. FH1]|uniref:hypothetical protein n=1 Tax=Chryseobacterium sp. FH1 TaxID=1233951 RepID=UPI0004E2A2EB|nr:hypothetical protein [Chryseobacterium sp. FH1]KFC19880.1 hypothetical protein IO90_11675 [Chryseobacterium sp. FH1]
MSITDRLFKKNNFPNECNDGTVKIVGNKIICEGNYGIQSCEVNINDIQYAYITVNVNKQSFLFLFDYHQNSIPTIYKGFKKVYEELSKRFKFNDSIFFHNVNRKVELKKEIWRRHHETTYELLNGNFNDYEKGFEIQSPKKQFITWDATYRDLEKNENISFEKSPYGQKIAKIKFPVRIGNIILKDFRSYFDNSRTDSPILHFYSQCFDKNGTDQSYFDLKRVLMNDIKMEENRLSYERSDQKNCNFHFNGMNLSICYTYDSDWQFNAGYTSLTIENKRNYPNLLIDLSYEENLQVSEYLILEGKIGISEDYKRNNKVKRRQPKITGQFQEKTVIWRDDRNNMIGFSSNQFSQVYDKEQIESFSIQNILPAKGSGGGYLEITLVSD